MGMVADAPASVLSIAYCSESDMVLRRFRKNSNHKKLQVTDVCVGSGTKRPTNIYTDRASSNGKVGPCRIFSFASMS